jgi:hypothetical protein
MVVDVVRRLTARDFDKSMPPEIAAPVRETVRKSSLERIYQRVYDEFAADRSDRPDFLRRQVIRCRLRNDRTPGAGRKATTGRRDRSAKPPSGPGSAYLCEPSSAT